MLQVVPTFSPKLFIMRFSNIVEEGLNNSVNTYGPSTLESISAQPFLSNKIKQRCFSFLEISTKGLQQRLGSSELYRMLYRNMLSPHP